MRKLIQPIAFWVIEWAAGYVITYFDIDHDGKVTKKEILSKLGPNMATLLKKMK
jgi:hypothetical protein